MEVLKGRLPGGKRRFVEENTPEVLGGPCQPQQVVGMEMAKYLVRCERKIIIALKV
jgi:hypothetical protein